MTDSVPGQGLNVKPDSANGSKAHSKDIEMFCEPCKEDGEVKLAEGFCVECQHYLCDECFRFHRLPKPMRHHRLLNKHEIPRKKVGEGLSEICPRHEGELIKYYCKSHGTVGCNCCMITEHKKCDEISILADIAKGIEKSTQYKQFCTRMARTKTDIENQLAKARENTEINKSCFKTAIAQINILQENINNKFDKLYQEITREAKFMMEKDIQRIQKLEDLANCAKDELQDLQGDMKVLEETKQRKQLFIAVIRGEEKQSDLEKRLAKVKTENTVKRYCFIPNEFMTSALQNIDTLGELCMYDGEESATELKSSYSNYQEYGFKRGISLSEQAYVILDSIFNSVELFVEDSSVTKRKLTSCPWDAVATSENTFALTLPNERKVKLLLLSNDDLTESHEIVADARCEGIDYAENKLFLACNKPAKVLILNMTGDIITEIKNDESGNYLFKQPAYISVNEERQLLCVTDRKTASATVLTMKEKRLAEVKTENTVKKYCFIPNEFMTSALQNIDTLGELCMYDGEESATELKSSYSNYQEYGFKRGILLSEQAFIILDSILNYVELHVIEKESAVTKKKLTSCPWDAVAINENQFAVTLPNKNKVKLFLLSNDDLTERREIMVDARCEGIDYAENKLFLACNKPAKVLILNMTGKIIKEITNDESGYYLFKQPAYISVHEKRQLLCVSDRKTASVTVLTMNGTIKNVLKNENMKYPLTTSIKETNSGQIKVTVYDLRNVLKFNIETGVSKVKTEEEDEISCIFSFSKLSNETGICTLTFCLMKADE